MDLTREIDAYCERLGPGLWAEPVNALTNLAFVIAALVMWRRAGGVSRAEGQEEGRQMARALCIVLGVIGIGSGLFHSFAQVWSALADVIPIAVFILLYLFAVNRDVLGLRPMAALGATALFLPNAALSGAVFAQVPGLGSSHRCRC